MARTKTKKYQPVMSKWELFIKKPAALIKIYAPKLTLNQAKLLNIFIFMIECKERFKLQQCSEISEKNRATIIKKFDCNAKDLYIISMDYIHALLIEKYKDNSRLENDIVGISSIALVLDYENNSKKITHFTRDIDIVNLAGIYIVIQFNDYILEILKQNTKYFKFFKIATLNNFSSIYSMKLYENIVNKYYFNPSDMLRRNKAFIINGDCTNDYTSKLKALNSNINNYNFIYQSKIKNDDVIKSKYELYKVLNMQEDNKYTTGSLKQYIENSILTEINNKFKEGLKELLVNKELRDSIKSKSTIEKDMIAGWVWPEVMIRAVWLKKSKIYGGNDARELKHIIFQFYRIVDIDIDKLLQYTAEDIDKLNFHIPIK